MNEQQLKLILEGALLAASRPLTLDELLGLFEESECPDRDTVRGALNALQEECAERSFQLKEVASGYRLQVKRELSPWVSRLWMERPSRYSRALLETLALVAYRQPITRGEIEDIRGVSVSSSIMKTLQEREWIRVVGHRDVPGKPAMYGTTRQFLDYFDLKSLDELPTLAELRDIDSINAELDLREPDSNDAMSGDEAVDGSADEAPGGASTSEPDAVTEAVPDHDPASETGVSEPADDVITRDEAVDAQAQERAAETEASASEQEPGSAPAIADQNPENDADAGERSQDTEAEADEDEAPARQWRENG